MAKVKIHVAACALVTSAGKIAAGTEILPDTHAKLFTKTGNPTKELKELVDTYKAVTEKEVTAVAVGKDDDESGKKAATAGDGSGGSNQTGGVTGEKDGQSGAETETGGKSSTEADGKSGTEKDGASGTAAK
ncbi:hypothetical protein SAMN04515647_3713 [Cohaesibacter sp. ES.047]|uniref:hypothetical protein n=1 Tax=Cohaesibacter sp. ES.047 TaxID=1798205 RepID=UPI000BB8AAF2|nr:hypothetical protein [Cohaesibacter sp. ES.047]SNY93418.1 hypothetical protein SAMN04515647_3713 [Cohaesibacter sp. ES.047]